MTTHTPPPRLSALHGHVQPGTFGAEGPGRPGVTLQEQRSVALMQINGTPPGAVLEQVLKPLALTAPSVNHAAIGETAQILWTGADQWLVASSDLPPEALLEALAGASQETSMTFTDLSHARTVVRVGGTMARELLAKGCPLDVDALEPGDCASSLLGPFSIVLHCRDRGEFDTYVFRSFGLAMWEWLTDEAAEFGYEVIGDT